MSAVLVNILVWLIEQFLPRGFEFLSVSHILSEALILFLYGVFQQYNMKKRIICTWMVGFLCVGIALLCKFAPYFNPEYSFFNVIHSFIYIGMYYAWGQIVCAGIIQKTQRRCLGGISALLIFWLFVSACRQFIFPYGSTADRYLWYAYYIPQILIAALSLLAALMVGSDENAKPGKWRLALFGGAAALILFVLTNDLHQLVFSFPGGTFRGSHCIYQPGYYMITGLIALCGVSAMALFIVKYRVPGRKKLAGFPIMCLVFMITYWILYFMEDSFVKAYLNDVTAVSCLMVAALFESLIESGLLRANIGYDNLFRKSTLAAQITDYHHQVRYTSEHAQAVPAEILAEAEAGPVMLNESTRLSEAAISGGHIYWEENVEELLSVQEELELTQEELRDTGDVLKAASEQKAYRLHLEMENKIYDVVEAQTASQIAALRGLSAQLQQTEEMDAAKKLLGKIVVIGTYIKRRSNLLFVAGQEGSIRSEELLLCVNESAESLRLYGVNCGVKISGCQRLAPEIAYMVYDILEAVIETGMETASSILICGEPQGRGLSLTICTDCTEDLSVLCQSFPDVRAEKDEDGLWYLSASLEIRGEGVPKI